MLIGGFVLISYFTDVVRVGFILTGRANLCATWFLGLFPHKGVGGA